MKYYSEKLEKLFDTVEELQTAEATEKTKKEKIAYIKEEIDKHFEEIANHKKAIFELQKELNKLDENQISDITGLAKLAARLPFFISFVDEDEN
jgi:predicted RNase H-like nuclease (RuvC/YqgF family)